METTIRSDAILVLINKPFNVLTHFRDAEGRATLADYVPLPNLSAAGRLDYDSEGLLLLTNAGWLQHLIAHPRYKLPKTYWVQVEGQPDEQALEALRKGVVFKGRRTRPAQARLMDDPPVWPRDPPIRERRDIPATWLEVVLREGRKRQVRHMTAAVGYPTLRLIRWAVGPWNLEGLQPGEWRQVETPKNEQEYFKMISGGKK